MGSLFFAQHNSWEIYQGIYMFWSFLSYWRVSHSIYELWFNHSLLAGHLGSFLFEVIMNKTVINMWVQIFFVWKCLPFAGINCPGVKLLGHMIVACQVFLRKWQRFTRVAGPFYISTSNAGATCCLYILITIWHCHYLLPIPMGITHCGSDLQFSKSYQCWTFVDVLICYLYVSSVVKCLYIFKLEDWTFLSFTLEILNVFQIIAPLSICGLHIFSAVW